MVYSHQLYHALSGTRTIPCAIRHYRISLTQRCCSKPLSSPSLCSVALLDKLLKALKLAGTKRIGFSTRLAATRAVSLPASSHNREGIKMLSWSLKALSHLTARLHIVVPRP